MGGRLFVISAPSGAGKTTLLKNVMARVGGLTFSISHTTREKRAGEIAGRDYHFVSKSEFRAMITEDRFLEYAVVHGNYYGTSRESVASTLAANADVILDIDVQGAAQLREEKGLDACQIFIAPPDLSQLKQRLQKRGSETKESLQLRLDNASKEMAQAGLYQYLLVNDDLEEAIMVLSAIVVAERARAHRSPGGAPIDLSLG